MGSVNGVKKLSVNKRNNNLFKILIGCAVVLFILGFLNIFILSIKNSFYVFSEPLQKTFWSAGESSSSFLASLLNAGSLAKENEDLKSQNDQLLSQLALLQSTQQGNQEQGEASAFYQNSGFKLLMAGVIGLEDNDILSINKGSADGISEGMPVINRQNVLYGKIFKVYKNFSEVMLISSKNSVVNVKIQQNQNNQDLQDASKNIEVDGVIKGNGNLSAYLDLIPISSAINPQDVLVTSAIDKFFPKDLLAAKIDQVQKNDQNPFQQAKINLYFDIRSVDNLFVITNYKQEK